jgi:hypothetical protein
MICALIRVSKGVVENLVVAQDTDPVGNDYLLKANPPAWVVPLSWTPDISAG